jgi:pilus assembly protein Flp/PilA
MNALFLKIFVELQDLLSREEGQDLVEYALICALLAFGIVGGMSQAAAALDSAFAHVSTTLGTYTT